MKETRNSAFQGRVVHSIRDEIISVHDDPDKDKQFFAKANTKLWDQLKELFSLVNSGKRLGKESIPAYNGGLFDPEKHLFLEHCKVSDYYLARAIDLLSRTRPKERQSRKKVTYRDLDIRHLGSIYEGILEYFPQLASEELAIRRCKEGSSTYEEFTLVSELSEEEKKHLDAYLKAIAEDPEMAKLPRNSKIVGHKKIGQYFLVYGGRTSKRKSSGSYYTPDYIVQYIVENTLGPLVRGECRAKAEIAPEEIASLFPPEDLPSGPLSSDEILQLKVLDPAMGSGHFLVAATEYLARAYSEALKREGKIKNEKMADDEFISYKRRVAERCIYGVDINAMAVELAKLSMWLFTMDKGRPLSFLDHHFKCGNSLIGTRVEDLGGSLFVNYFKGKLPPIIKDIFGIIEKDTITFDDVKAKKAHDQAVENAKLEFKNIADVYVSSFFGEKTEDYLAMMTNTELARNTKSKTASEYKFFHWQIEFPEVFFNKFGQDLDNAGFDAVIGNPPYGAYLSEVSLKYFATKFRVGTTDTAALMMAQAIKLTKTFSRHGLIVPKPFTYSSNWEKVRKTLLKDMTQLVDVGRVWKNVKLEQIIYFLQLNSNTSDYKSFYRKEQEIVFLTSILKSDCENFNFFLNGVNALQLSIAQKMSIKGTSLGNFVSNNRGGTFQKLINKDSFNGKRVIGGKQVQRFIIENEKGYISRMDLLPLTAFVKTNSILVQNIVAHIANPTDHIKIIGTIVNEEEAKNIVILDTVNQLTNASDLSSLYLLGLLLSKLINWFVYNFIFAKAIRTMHFDSPVSDKIPIYPIDFSNPTDKARHDQMVTLVERMLELHKNLATATDKQKPFIQRQIDETDKEIDELVYQLYGLTDEEIAIVEAATR